MNNNYKILIVDDDPTLCLIAERMLSAEGYRVLTAGTGEQGINCFQEHSPDLLMLDYGLPDMSGLDVCQKIRSLPSANDRPILFITAKHDYQSIDNAFNVGATDFSHKPLNWAILIYRIKYLLHSHQIYLSMVSSQSKLMKMQKIAKMVNWEYDLNTQKFSWTDSVCKLLEIKDQREIQLEKFLSYVAEYHQESVKKAIDKCLFEDRDFQLEYELKTANGNTKIVSHFGHVVKNNKNGIVEYIGTIQDITERRNYELQIRKLAYYDSLTGLMNRESFIMAMEEILNFNRENNNLSALLFIDLDDFKRVNDTLGHDCGDDLLCEITNRLKNSVRLVEQEHSNNATQWLDASEGNHVAGSSAVSIKNLDLNRYDIGRLGGDEFTVFLSQIKHVDDVNIVARRLLKSLEDPFKLKNYEVYVTFSIGIAIAPHHGDDTATLLKKSDTAMYHAKTHGKNNFQIYIDSMSNSSLNRLTLESALRNAIKKNQLHLVYQPKIDLQTGRLIGAEALMRWTHETIGAISPSEFIPLAEQTGQILIIGDWLFNQFSQHLNQWNQEKLIPKDFKLALNVSSMQFHQSSIMSKVGETFSDLELNKNVEFELTETVMMENAVSNLEKLDELVENNISLSIDDFGTGYSSLSYLHKFPVDTVKIDRSFISNLESDGQLNIIKAIIAMAHGMGIKVVAEGIENQWQYEFLKSEGCDIGQGYYFHKPMEVQSFQQILEQYSIKSEGLCV